MSSSHELVLFQCLLPRKKAEGKENFANFSLAEALAYGRVEIADREAWLCGRVKRPCLVIQVDVWEMESIADAKLTEDQLTFFWSACTLFMYYICYFLEQSNKEFVFPDILR